ncbi:hypothetical protein QNM99_16900 [Pseudomonas sp. PCH446]
MLLNVVARYLVISRHGDGPARVNYQVRRNSKVFTSPELELEVFLQLPGPQTRPRRHWSTRPWPHR